MRTFFDRPAIDIDPAKIITEALQLVDITKPISGEKFLNIFFSTIQVYYYYRRQEIKAGPEDAIVEKETAANTQFIDLLKSISFPSNQTAYEKILHLFIHYQPWSEELFAQLGALTDLEAETGFSPIDNFIFSYCKGTSLEESVDSLETLLTRSRPQSAAADFTQSSVSNAASTAVKSSHRRQGNYSQCAPGITPIPATQARLRAGSDAFTLHTPITHASQPSADSVGSMLKSISRHKDYAPASSRGSSGAISVVATPAVPQSETIHRRHDSIMETIKKVAADKSVEEAKQKLAVGILFSFATFSQLEFLLHHEAIQFSEQHPITPKLETALAALNSRELVEQLIRAAILAEKFEQAELILAGTFSNTLENNPSHQPENGPTAIGNKRNAIVTSLALFPAQASAVGVSAAASIYLVNAVLPQAWVATLALQLVAGALITTVIAAALLGAIYGIASLCTQGEAKETLSPQRAASAVGDEGTPLLSAAGSPSSPPETVARKLGFDEEESAAATPALSS